MKRKLSALCAGALALSLAACGGAPSSSASAQPAPSAGASAPVEAGGFDTAQDITVVTREEGSGTRGAFIELTGVEQKDADGNKVDMTTVDAVNANSTNNVMQTVCADETAIGYISMGSLNDTVKAVTVDGVEATPENVKDGSYTLARPFNVVTGGAAGELAQDFLAYIMSAEGQAVIAENHYIGDDAAAPYAGAAPAGKLVVGGSTSVSPVMEKLIEAYQAVNPNAEIELQTSDSTMGISGALDGTYDIGMASRALKDSELEAGAVSTVIAMDGIAVVVNAGNPIANLSVEQICGIYTGELTVWSELQ